MRKKAKYGLKYCEGKITQNSIFVNFVKSWSRLKFSSIKSAIGSSNKKNIAGHVLNLRKLRKKLANTKDACIFVFNRGFDLFRLEIDGFKTYWIIS